MAQFQLKSRIKGFKTLDGMTAQVFNEEGDLLDSIDLENSKKKFKFSFDQDDALQGQNSADLTIKLTDTNGDSINLQKRNGAEYDLDSDEQTFSVSISDRKKRGRANLRPAVSRDESDTDAPVFTSSTTSSVSDDVAAGTIVYDAEASDASPLSFSLAGTDAASFSIDAQSGEVAINASPDLETKSSYSFEVVATEAAGNSSSQTVALAVTASEQNNTGDTITLSAQQDVVSDSVGGQVIGTEFVENDQRFTPFADTVNAAAGSLGSNDDLTDTTAGDADQLRLAANAANTLEDALGSVSRVVGLESLDVTATNDTSVNADLGAFQGLESVSASGSFTNQLVVQNYLLAGARSFDFSGVNTGGVNLSDNGVATNDAITMIGSGANDVLQANNGVADLRGGGGNDALVGSAIVGSLIEGGTGADTITLQAANSADTVSLARITANSSADLITNFVGADANNNAADLLRFDAATFNTYSAGQDVDEVLAAAAHESQSSNLFIVDVADAFADINQDDTNIPLNTESGEATLGLATDTGAILYASNGNFANAVQIGTIDNNANANDAFDLNFVAAANVDIV